MKSRFTIVCLLLIGSGCSSNVRVKPTSTVSIQAAMPAPVQARTTCLNDTGERLSEPSGQLFPQGQLERWGQEARTALWKDPEAKIGYDWIDESLRRVTQSPDDYSIKLKLYLFRVATAYLTMFRDNSRCDVQTNNIATLTAAMFR